MPCVEHNNKNKNKTTPNPQTSQSKSKNQSMPPITQTLKSQRSQNQYKQNQKSPNYKNNQNSPNNNSSSKTKRTQISSESLYLLVNSIEKLTIMTKNNTNKKKDVKEMLNIPLKCYSSNKNMSILNKKTKTQTQIMILRPMPSLMMIQ